MALIVSTKDGGEFTARQHRALNREQLFGQPAEVLDVGEKMKAIISPIRPDALLIGTGIANLGGVMVENTTSFLSIVPSSTAGDKAVVLTVTNGSDADFNIVNLPYTPVQSDMLLNPLGEFSYVICTFYSDVSKNVSNIIQTADFIPNKALKSLMPGIQGGTLLISDNFLKMNGGAALTLTQSYPQQVNLSNILGSLSSSNRLNLTKGFLYVIEMAMAVDQGEAIFDLYGSGDTISKMITRNEAKDQYIRGYAVIDRTNEATTTLQLRLVNVEATAGAILSANRNIFRVRVYKTFVL